MGDYLSGISFEMGPATQMAALLIGVAAAFVVYYKVSGMTKRG